jgi:hypothetical protein
VTHVEIGKKVALVEDPEIIIIMRELGRWMKEDNWN